MPEQKTLEDLGESVEPIVFVPVESIKPAPWNPRMISELDLKGLKQSIIDDPGLLLLHCPLVRKATMEIYDGSQRWLAVKELGHKTIPCRITDITEEEAKVRSAKKNNHHGQDNQSSNDFLKEVGGIVSLLTVGHAVIIEKVNLNLEEDDKVPSTPTVPKSKLGDLYILGNHRLLCADSTKKENVERLMNGEKADMVFTDPPYGIELDTDTIKVLGKNAKSKKFDRIIGDGEPFDPSCIFQNFGYCKEILIWGADYFSDLIPNKNEGAWLVWDKRVTGHEDKKNYASEFELCWSKAHRARRIYKHDWVRFFGMQKEDTKCREHPNQKPTALLKGIMPEGDICVDLFGGSGSTLIACEQLNRKCYMMEIDPRYIDVIVSRWEKFTGNRAKLLVD